MITKHFIAVTTEHAGVVLIPVDNIAAVECNDLGTSIFLLHGPLKHVIVVEKVDAIGRMLTKSDSIVSCP